MSEINDFDISNHDHLHNTNNGRTTKPAGRPKGNPEDKKNKRVVGYLTESEYEELEKILGRDVKPATWCRNLILDFIKNNKYK